MNINKELLFARAIRICTCQNFLNRVFDETKIWTFYTKILCNFDDIFKSIANEQMTTTLWIILNEQRKRAKKLIWKTKNRRKEKRCANRRFSIKKNSDWSNEIK